MRQAALNGSKTVKLGAVVRRELKQSSHQHAKQVSFCLSFIIGNASL
jgi:hypothetical protein